MKVRLLSFCAALAFGLGWLACSGSPSTPSGSDASVTIQGSVNPSVSAASVGRKAAGSQSSSSSGISVTIDGTSVSTMTDSSGHFVLHGVPSGSVTLHFKGQGIDATLTLTGLTSGETLTISVKLTGNDAELEPEDPESPSPEPTAAPTCFAVGEHAEVEGNITALGASTITVDQEGHGSFLCMVTTSTTIVHGNKTILLTDLHMGDHVHVSGTGAGMTGGKCTVNATEIKVQNGD